MIGVFMVFLRDLNEWFEFVLVEPALYHGPRHFFFDILDDFKKLACKKQLRILFESNCNGRSAVKIFELLHQCFLFIDFSARVL